MNNGICTLSNIPVRKEDSSKSEMVTMLLFGETYTVLETVGDWHKIRIHDDLYEGWMNNKQHSSFSETIETITTINQFPCIICQKNNEQVYLLPGSQIINQEGNIFSIGDDVYTLPSHSTSSNLSLDLIGDLATKFLNAPYLWGGKSMFGIDCSGFTQVVFKMLGIQLKRDAYLQAEMGSDVAFRESSQLGDLAFFDNDEGVITHVGIMLEPNKIIHASGMVRIDEIDNFGIINSELKEYSHKLRIIKRIEG